MTYIVPMLHGSHKVQHNRLKWFAESFCVYVYNHCPGQIKYTAVVYPFISKHVNGGSHFYMINSFLHFSPKLPICTLYLFLLLKVSGIATNKHVIIFNIQGTTFHLIKRKKNKYQIVKQNDSSLSWLGRVTSVKSGGVTLISPIANFRLFDN